jgi:hypothetical protein
MARKSRQEELFEMLRARGLRTRVARTLSDAASAGRGGASTGTTRAKGMIADLRKVADDLEERITGKSSGKSRSRSEAAKKAARTRARKANARSAAAKKAAATRKSGSSRTTRSRAKAKS